MQTHQANFTEFSFNKLFNIFRRHLHVQKFSPKGFSFITSHPYNRHACRNTKIPVSSVLFFWTVHRSDPNVKEILCVHSSTEHLGQHGFIGLQANAHVCVCAVHAFVAKLIAAPVELMAKRQSTKQCDPCVNITNVWFRTQKATNNNFGNFPSFLFVEKKVFFQWIGNQLVCK